MVSYQTGVPEKRLYNYDCQHREYIGKKQVQDFLFCGAKAVEVFDQQRCFKLPCTEDKDQTWSLSQRLLGTRLRN